MSAVRSVGIEEEMFLVDPRTAQLLPVSQQAVHADEQRPDSDEEDVQQELYLQQIEANTEPTHALDDLRDHVVAARRRAAEAAAAGGAVLLAAATPLLADQDAIITPKGRYRRALQRYGQLARQSVVCGMHVHVEIADDEEGVRIIDALAPWLPLILALSAGSPFGEGVDTRYASWRAQIWDALPSAGPVEPFGSAEAYHRAIEDLIASGAALDEAMIYFDARLARSHPTVEIRVADVCTDVDDALVVAALVRALVETLSSASDTATWRVELMRGARWLARREGLTGDLLHPVTARPVPAADAMAALLLHVGDALDSADDSAFVRDGVDRLLREGGPAGRQRAVAGPNADVEALAHHLIERTDATFR